MRKEKESKGKRQLKKKERKKKEKSLEMVLLLRPSARPARRNRYRTCMQQPCVHCPGLQAGQAQASTGACCPLSPSSLSYRTPLRASARNARICRQAVAERRSLRPASHARSRDRCSGRVPSRFWAFWAFWALWRSGALVGFGDGGLAPSFSFSSLRSQHTLFSLPFPLPPTLSCMARSHAVSHLAARARATRSTRCRRNLQEANEQRATGAPGRLLASQRKLPDTDVPGKACRPPQGLLRERSCADGRSDWTRGPPARDLITRRREPEEVPASTAHAVRGRQTRLDQ